MNRFVLDTNPVIAAQYHCDKHVVKMILEEAQMLSTAHRILDGVETVGESKSGRAAKRWTLNDEREDHLYKATHVNHPCTQWVMESNNNYNWAVCLFMALLKEYTNRYGKAHKCEGMLELLLQPPRNIRVGYLTQFPQAMPDECKHENPVDGYRDYYINHKARFAKWTNRSVPEWFTCSSS
jgi:hypothetical protein